MPDANTFYLDQYLDELEKADRDAEEDESNEDDKPIRDQF